MNPIDTPDTLAASLRDALIAADRMRLWAAAAHIDSALVSLNGEGTPIAEPTDPDPHASSAGTSSE